MSSFQPGDRVRLIDARPAAGSKRRPTMPTDSALEVWRVVDGGGHVEIRGYPGYWRAERFEAAP